MTGKERCEYLKRVRADFARVNGIEFTPVECTHEGECSGHCPACDREAEQLLAHFNLHLPERTWIPFNLENIISQPVNGDNIDTDWEEMGLPF